MYLLRRIARTQPGKAWAVAGYLTKICAAYEQAGRSKSNVYVGSAGLTGSPDTAYAEWTQDTIAPNWRSQIPPAVMENNAPMQQLLTSYELEIYELVTDEKLKDRNINV